MFYASRGEGAYLNGQRLPLKTVVNTMCDAIASVEVKYLRSGKLAARIGSTCPAATCAIWAPARWTGVIWRPAATIFIFMAVSGCGITPPGR